MKKELDDGARKLLADEARHEVELVVVHQHERARRRAAREADHPGRHLPVDLDVTVGPSLVDAIVDHRLAGEVPEVVLEEPQHRIGDDRVVLLVLLPGRRGVVELARRLRQWDDVPALVL